MKKKIKLILVYLWLAFIVLPLYGLIEFIYYVIPFFNIYVAEKEDDYQYKKYSRMFRGK